MKTVFIVDDSATNLFIAGEALKNKYRALTIPSAEKMFKLIEKIMPNIILLDIEMPDMNGYQTMEILKSNEKHKNIPVIFLTGSSDAKTKNEGLALGAVEFITKPFHKEHLLETLERYIN